MSAAKIMNSQSQKKVTITEAKSTSSDKYAAEAQNRPPGLQATDPIELRFHDRDTQI